MRNLIIGLIAMLIFPVFGFCAEENQPLTLKECYSLALKQSELIAVDYQHIKEAEAHFLEALGTVLPQVSFSRQETRDHSQGFPSYNRTFEQKFVFTQALFSGFKEFAGMAGSNFEKRQRENEKLRAEQLLFTDVSDAFYLLMEVREDQKTLETIRDALTDRIKNLRGRESLGKSRKSEVVSTEVQLYSLQADIESARGQELIARQLLEFLVGRHVDEIAEPGIDFSLKPESEYLAQAAIRPDVQAADFARKTDQERITVARSGLFPQVNIEGDYFTHRSSVPVDSRWETMLTIDVPIFEGTTTYGQVKEAHALAKESELLFKRAGRSAVQDIHDSYVNVQSDVARRNVLKEALKSAELNYKLQIQDYQLNVVNNLDVLTAIQTLGDMRRTFIHTLYESKRFYWQLLVAAGEISLDK